MFSTLQSHDLFELNRFIRLGLTNKTGRLCLGHTPYRRMCGFGLRVSHVRPTGCASAIGFSSSPFGEAFSPLDLARRPLAKHSRRWKYLSGCGCLCRTDTGSVPTCGLPAELASVVYYPLAPRRLKQILKPNSRKRRVL